MARETYVADRETGEIVTKMEYIRRQELKQPTNKFRFKEIERVVGAKYVWDREKQKVVEASEYYQDRAKPTVHVIKDLDAYKSAVTGEMVDGRRAHRDHLKRHDVVEVGNDHWSGKKPELDHPGHDLKRVFESNGL